MTLLIKLLFCHFQGVILYLLGPRISWPGPQGGDDQWRGAHSIGAQPVLHLPTSILRPSLPVAMPGLELPQVRWTWCQNSTANIHALVLRLHSGPFPLIHLVLFLTSRAGFARQGAKEKQLLKQGNAFNVSPFVLRAMMSGQYWPEGDEVYHAELTVPILLIHGMCDKFVPVDEDQRMAEVRRESCLLCMWHIGFWCCGNCLLFICRSSCLPSWKWLRRGATWSWWSVLTPSTLSSMNSFYGSLTCPEKTATIQTGRILLPSVTLSTLSVRIWTNNPKKNLVFTEQKALLARVLKVLPGWELL